jgi:hypothetical protein
MAMAIGRSIINFLFARYVVVYTRANGDAGCISTTHNNESSIKCEWENCRKIFATKSLRNEHLQHHAVQGPSPNTCEICGKLWPTRVDY